MKNISVENEVCCPEFDPAIWDDKIIEWDDKRFVKHPVFTIFNIPVNFGRVMQKLDKVITKSGGNFDGSICLSHHTGRWNMDIYLAVDKGIDGADNILLSGKYLFKVYEGPFNKTGEWCEDYKKYAESQGFEIIKWYMWYTTCPKCARKYGKNYVVIACQVH